jgi:hypothetical protein
MSAEKLGYHLGLIVHPDKAYLFYNVRTSKEKPPAGYGTRTYLSEFEPNIVFQKLKIPLLFTKKLITQFNSKKEITTYLQSAEKEDKDVLLCFNHGAFIDDPSKDYGHVCVFDRIIGDKIRIIDPSPDQPKWKMVSIEKMFHAMKKHGEKKSGGFWELKLMSQSGPLPPLRYFSIL